MPSWDKPLLDLHNHRESAVLQLRLRMHNISYTTHLKLFISLGLLHTLLLVLPFTVAGTGLKVLHGLTERVALSVVTPAVVNTHHVVHGIFRRWTFTAVA